MIQVSTSIPILIICKECGRKYMTQFFLSGFSDVTSYCASDKRPGIGI